LENVEVNDSEPAPRPVRVDSGLHIAAFVGDANSSRTYSSADTTLVQRMIVGRGNGFTTFQQADPMLIADINRSNTLTSADATLVQRLIVGTPITQAPPIPGDVTPPAPSGPGSTVVHPDRFDGGTRGDRHDPRQAGGDGTNRDFGQWHGLGDCIRCVGDERAELPSGSDAGDGLCIDDQCRHAGHHPCDVLEGRRPRVLLWPVGVVFEFDATVLAEAPDGQYRINLLSNAETTVTQVTNNDLDELQLVPAPTNADDDPVDGLLTVGSQVVATSTVVASSVNPSTYGGGVYFTATVTSASGTPSGTVQFLVGGSNLGDPVALVDGTAQSLTISTLIAGTHLVTAHYQPEASSGFESSVGELSGGQVVNQKLLTASGTAASKVYDGTTDAVVTIIGRHGLGRYGHASASGTFDSKNVGSVKTVTIGPVTLSGADAGNYTVGAPGTTTANITPAALTVGGITALDKVYDGTVAAALDVNDAALEGVIPGRCCHAERHRRRGSVRRRGNGHEQDGDHLGADDRGRRRAQL
jgi:hypothetical protein